MDKLPSEIIREVFLQDVLASQESMPFGTILAPLYLSHVCRRWRIISLAFGELWSFLWIYCDRASKVDIFHTWLERTNGAPINFSVACWVEDEDVEGHEATEQIVLILLSQQHRWEEVHFTWKFIASSRLTEIRMNEMSRLRSLVLELDIRGQRDELIAPRIDLARSPDIKAISLLNGTYFVDCGSATLPALTTVNLNFTGEGNELQAVKICTDLLKAAPNCVKTYVEVLEEGESPVDNAPEREAASPEHIVHNMETLDIACIYEGPSTLLNRLTLPALKNLTFHDSDTFNPGEVVLACIERSLPPLVCLDLRGNSSDEQYVIPALRLLPALVHLELRYPVFSERFFKELTCYGDTNTTSTTCPALEVVYLGSLFGVTDELKCATAFCTMVESRWKYLKKFKKVELDKVKDKVDASTIHHYEEEVKQYFYSTSDEARIRISGGDNDRAFRYHDY